MYIGYDEEQEALCLELRAYYDKLLTPEIREGLHHGRGVGEVMRAVVKQMGTDGWLGIGWPEEYGGQGRSEIEQFIFFDESMRAGAPVPMLTINTVGPQIMKNGTDEQKQFYLPKILAGEIHFAIGYSEPQAGTDLASLTTRADREGDEYVVNGQKTWTSLASDAEYCWMAVRTDPEAAKHAGLSILIMDLKNSPGLRIDPLDLLSSHDINQMFLDDVRIPVSNLIGKEGQGWKLITGQLNHERVTICSSGILERAFAQTREFAQRQKLPDGRRVIDQEWVQINLARVYAGLEFLKLINWKVAWSSTQQKLDPADASTIKVFGTEWYLESFRLMMEIIGPRSYLTRESPDQVEMVGHLEVLYRSLLILTFGGGTNEIQRDLIGLFGLGFPRVPRM
ncbi:MAG: acyl-CoA dehydrogenase family protein [Myxococcales bacterium]|nr:acyl-CoA dehydrogenase family protein [Myxococcales bacterium]